MVYFVLLQCPSSLQVTTQCFEYSTPAVLLRKQSLPNVVRRDEMWQHLGNLSPFSKSLQSLPIPPWPHRLGDISEMSPSLLQVPMCPSSQVLYTQRSPVPHRSEAGDSCRDGKGGLHIFAELNKKQNNLLSCRWTRVIYGRTQIICRWLILGVFSYWCC